MNITKKFVGGYGQDVNLRSKKEFDKINPISNPIFVENGDALLEPDANIIGYYDGTQYKAIPLQILDQREIVLDEYYDGDNQYPISVTYSPLTRSAVVFRGAWGNSGLLYNSNSVYYNRMEEREFLPQLLMKSIRGKKIKEVPSMNSQVTTAKQWLELHPESLVVVGGGPNEKSYDYTKEPYPNYHDTDLLLFPVEKESKKYHPKQPVTGVLYKDKVIALVNQSGAKRKKIRIKDVGNFLYQNGHVEPLFENPVKIVNSYWFAWYAFYPGTQLAEF